MRSVPAGTAEEADLGVTALSFEEFYETTFRRLFTALCLVTGNRHEGEEVVQEAYVRVFERWEHVGVLKDPTGYLFPRLDERVPEQLPTNRARPSTHVLPRARLNR